MDKTKPDQALSGKPIAKKIVAEMRLHWQRKVVNIKNVIVGDAMAEELQKTVVARPPIPQSTSALSLPVTHRFTGRSKQKGRLAAMASERMKHIGHSEISGVCAHPDFRGRGFARALSAAVAQEIIARGEGPYLHSYSENTSAIRPYESLGVQIRCEMHAAVLTRL